MNGPLVYLCSVKTGWFIIPLIFLAICSCERENTDSDPCRDNAKIRQVKADSLVIEEMTYTGECRIYEYIQEFSYKKYSYDGQGYLTKIEQALTLDPAMCFMPVGSQGEVFADPRKARITQYHAFEYDDERKLIKKLHYFLNGDQFRLVSYSSYDYENDQVRQVNQYNNQGELSQKNRYYYDEKGNMIRDEYFFREGEAVFVLMYTKEYVFDDKGNPYRIFENEGIPGVYTNRNNIIKSVYTDHISGDEYTYTEEFSYEYNASGLPVKRQYFTYTYGD